MEEIKQWFAHKDYNQGVMLLVKYSKSRTLIESLSRKSFPAKLEYELKKILDRNGIKPAPPASKEPKPPAPVTDAREIVQEKGKIIKINYRQRSINYPDLPPKLRSLVDDNTIMYKKARSLHEKLKLMHKSSNKDRKPLVKELVQLDDQIRTNWAKVDEWEPGQDLEEETKPVEVDHRRINANRKYISSNKVKLKGKNAESWKPKIQARVDELLSAGETFKSEIVKELKELGIHASK